MKNALILHGTNADHSQNWFPWLNRELSNIGYRVWSPDLPRADHPDINRYNSFLLSNSSSSSGRDKDWHFNDQTIIIGHSSGAVEILALLSDPSFPKDVKLEACFLVGAFKGDLGWESLKGMVGNFDYHKIKHRSSKFIFLHSDTDPYCPIDDARDLSKKVSGELIELPSEGHFTVSLDPKYSAFPVLLEIIKKSV